MNRQIGFEMYRYQFKNLYQLSSMWCLCLVRFIEALVAVLPISNLDRSVVSDYKLSQKCYLLYVKQPHLWSDILVNVNSQINCVKGQVLHILSRSLYGIGREMAHGDTITQIWSNCVSIWEGRENGPSFVLACQLSHTFLGDAYPLRPFPNFPVRRHVWKPLQYETLQWEMRICQYSDSLELVSRYKI